MRTVKASSKTTHARRVRVLRTAWGDTIEKAVKERIGDSRHAPGMLFCVLKDLLDTFRNLDAIAKSDVEEAVASACKHWRGTPPVFLREDFEQIYPDWDGGVVRDADLFTAEPVTRSLRG